MPEAMPEAMSEAMPVASTVIGPMLTSLPVGRPMSPADPSPTLRRPFVDQPESTPP
jgi:hypothetical protein